MKDLLCRALAEGSNAAGADRLRPGFCFRTEDDLAFALGFPYLRYLDPDGLDDLDPRANAERCLLEPGAELELVLAPRTAAYLARGWLVPEPVTPYPGDPELTPEARDAIDGPEALASGAAHPAIRAALSLSRVAPTAAEALLLWEAWLGTEEVVAAGLDALGALDGRVDTWTEPGRARALSMLALMTFRLPPVRSAACMRDLEARLAGLSSGERTRAGLAWSGAGASVPVDGPAVDPTPARVREAFRAGPRPFGAVPDSRLAFLGGEELFEGVAADWRSHATLPPEITHARILERFAPVDHPLVVSLMLDLWRRSAVSDGALAWLEAHQALVRPVATRLATGSTRFAADASLFLARARDDAKR